MKAVMLMFDTLSRRYLENYGSDWTKTPNFKRLGERSVTFDNFYVGSLPCMPARRELHTGRLNFLHRGWSPLEPFDDSMPEILKKNGIYTHLVTDHQHYWEDGGATYHNRYSSYEFIRGQEGDLWKGVVNDPKDLPDKIRNTKGFQKTMLRQDFINRKYMTTEKEHVQARTFSAGLEFLNENKDADNWFLQLEYFDPHEPFFVPDRFKEMYPDNYEDKFDWPPYASSTDDCEEKKQHVKNNYAALISMCDYYLGQVLDFMDDNDMWKDTMLIVNTDHGFLMSEKEWWGKSVMPTYNEIAHTPFFIWSPDFGIKGERRNSLAQTIDIAPTILEFFNQEIPVDMQGVSLSQIIADDKPVREYGLFGYHGGHVNITDGKNLYMRANTSMDNTPLYEYTLMPMDMRSMKPISSLHTLSLHEPFSFTKGTSVLKMEPSFVMSNMYLQGHKLFNLENDPNQECPIDNIDLEVELCKKMVELMKENDAPIESYERIGLNGAINSQLLKKQRDEYISFENKLDTEIDLEFSDNSKDYLLGLLTVVPREKHLETIVGFKMYITNMKREVVGVDDIKQFATHIFPAHLVAYIDYFFDARGRRN